MPIPPLHPKNTAVIVVDMWDGHDCSTLLSYLDQLAVKMNAWLTQLRSIGVTIVFAPSQVDNWISKHEDAGYQMRPTKAQRALPFTGPGYLTTGFVDPQIASGMRDEVPPPGACMCPPGVQNHSSKIENQNSKLYVDMQSDLILYCTNPKVAEVESLSAPAFQGLAELPQNITNLLYVGAATNICVTIREYGLYYASRLRSDPDDASSRRYQTYVISDLTLPYVPQTGENTWMNWQDKAVQYLGKKGYATPMTAQEAQWALALRGIRVLEAVGPVEKKDGYVYYKIRLPAVSGNPSYWENASIQEGAAIGDRESARWIGLTDLSPVQSDADGWYFNYGLRHASPEQMNVAANFNITVGGDSHLAAVPISFDFNARLQPPSA